MTTTMFIPLSAGQAEWSFLNRAEAFARGFDTSRDGTLVAFQRREDAIAAAAGKHVRRFALLHIEIEHATHEALAYAGDLNGAGVDETTGAPVWKLSTAGSAKLAESARLTMEILPCQLALSEMQRVDVFSIPEPTGPTGLGGC